MDTEKKTKRREWVKTAAIIFLVVLLVLTFFSQTIMNHSLPEVATQSVESGSINAKIRGSGTVTANEAYEVTIKQTRKIKSVMVKEGQEVAAGDVLFILEAEESDEVKAAQDALEAEELSYQKALLSSSNTNAANNYALKKAQKEYNDALAAYKAYTDVDVSQLQSGINSAQVQVQVYKQQYENAEAAVETATGKYEQATGSVSEIQGQITELQNIQDAAAKLTQASSDLSRDNIIYGADYERLRSLTGGNESMMAAWAKSPELILAADESITEYEASAMSEAYGVISEDNAAISAAQLALDRLVSACSLITDASQVTSALYSAQASLSAAQAVISGYDAELASLKQTAAAAKAQLEAVQAELDKLNEAKSAAATLESAEEALEQLMFDQSLGSSDSLDLQAQKERIDELRTELSKLQEDYDAAEVTSDVNGTVSTISVSAGGTAGADTPLATINVTSRGYTIQISVTNEQAKKVKIGDTAEVSNYYWGNDLEATLEGIKNAEGGKSKSLVFKLTGDVESGTNLTLSIGQKSANYDALVPNSAVRSDSNGSFVLAIVSKSSPLGNRYVASRVDVQVLASDDTLTAVSGISAGEFVITTSTSPVEAGTQVRLADTQ